MEKCVISSPKHFRNYRGKKTLRNNLPCGKLQVETNPACGNNTGGKLPWGKIESTVGKQFEFFYREPACRPIHFVSLHTPKCFSRKPRMAPQRPERADPGFLTIRNFVLAGPQMLWVRSLFSSQGCSFLEDRHTKSPAFRHRSVEDTCDARPSDRSTCWRRCSDGCVYQ